MNITFEVLVKALIRVVTPRDSYQNRRCNVFLRNVLYIRLFLYNRHDYCTNPFMAHNLALRNENGLGHHPGHMCVVRIYMLKIEIRR